jgi:hypothetical protein
MNPALRTVAMSPSVLPFTPSVTAAATPTKPVKMFITATSRLSSSSAPPPGASAARAWPTSQMPFTTSTAPTYSRTTASSIGALLSAT